MIADGIPAEASVTWTAFLNIVNTGLIIVAGFLAREAWRNIHGRIDDLERMHGDMRERVAWMEAQWDGPRRRRTDPHKAGGQ